MQGSGKGGRITVEDVRRAMAAGARGRVILRDGSEGGLYLRAGGRGAVWWVEFKPPGRAQDGRRHATRHHKLGPARALSPDDARDRAARAKQAVLDGQDPQAERRAAQERAAAPSWDDVKADYLAHLDRRLSHDRSRQNEVRYLAHVFDALDGKPARLDPTAPLRTIDLRAVHRLLDLLPSEGVLGRQVLGALSRLLDWARVRGISDTPNPVRLLPRGARPKKAAARMRALSPAEIGAVWKGAEKLKPFERDLLRFLLAVPLRKGEASALRWEWIDRQARTITLPKKMMKNGQPHRLPLGDLAEEVLVGVGGAEWPKSGAVFPSRNKRTIDWGRFRGRVDEAAPLAEPWVFHDLRRSFVSALAERGHAEPVLDMLIAHKASATRSGVLGIYQTAARWPEQQAAMAAWDRLIAAEIGRGNGGNVVPLRA